LRKYVSVLLFSLAGMLLTCSAQENKVNPALLDPESAAMRETAPATYKVLFNTSKGDFTIEVTRDWAPKGADRFYNLVKNGFYDNVRFFRVIRGFMVQFGISGEPAVAEKWAEAAIADDPAQQSNTRGMISFATRGANTRTTQVFINFGDNARLDGLGFAPFGKVISGMDIVDQLFADYGEGAPNGAGPSQDRMAGEGNAYLNRDFPKLDYVKSARIQ
jgi:peptidyl-prolyl cis-trans isomerase A (cyclophilin A)